MDFCGVIGSNSDFAPVKRDKDSSVYYCPYPFSVSVSLLDPHARRIEIAELIVPIGEGSAEAARVIGKVHPVDFQATVFARAHA